MVRISVAHCLVCRIWIPDSDKQVMLDLLSEVAEKLLASEVILFGLQNMSSDKQEVLDVLSVLYDKILTSANALNAQKSAIHFTDYKI